MTEVATQAEFDSAVAAEDIVITVTEDMNVTVLPTHKSKLTVLEGVCLNLNDQCYMHPTIGSQDSLIADYEEDAEGNPL